MYEKKPASDRFIEFLGDHWILGLAFGLTCFIVGGYICLASIGLWTPDDADNMSSIGNAGAGVWIGGGVGIMGLIYAGVTIQERITDYLYDRKYGSDE